jgi:hypothetical protein
LKVSLIVSNRGVKTDELDGFELIVGDEWKGAFGEYTPNVVYVRNHDLKTDYEIIEQEGPHPTPEDE